MRCAALACLLLAASGCERTVSEASLLACQAESAELRRRLDAPRVCLSSQPYPPIVRDSPTGNGWCICHEPQTPDPVLEISNATVCDIADAVTDECPMLRVAAGGTLKIESMMMVQGECR